MGEDEECREQQLLEVESLQAILGSSDHSHSGDGEATEIPGDASFQVRGDGTVREPFHLRCEVDVALPPNEVIDIVVVADSEEACGAYAEAVSPHSDSTSESRKSQPPLTLRGIKYLPPVTLHLVMPLTYPLVAPPELSFECVWFDAQATARVRTELVRMWDEVYQGGPVVYSWLEWLQYELVDRLLEEATSVNVREEEDKEGEKGKEAATGGAEAASEAGSRRRRLVLRGPPPSLPSTNNEEDYVDDTKTSTSSCTSSTWPTRFRLILAHAYVQASAAFLRGTHTCYICFEEHPGHSFVTLQCGHWWCRPCLTTMASTYVGEGGQHLQWLVCPRPDCAAEITPDILKHDLLSSEEYERWERLSLLQALDKMGDVARCPRCQTPCLTEGGKKEGGSEGGAVSGGAAAGDLGECPQCFFVFCPQCQDAYHAGTPCYSSEARLKQVEAEIARLMASSHGGKSLAPSQNARLEKLRRAAEESLSRKVVEKNARSCPACGMSVEKVEGCNKMRCQCGVLWCWKCRKDISSEGYAHFREGAVGACNLWEAESLLAWQRQMMMMEGGREGGRVAGWGGGGGDLHGEMARMLQWGRGWDGGGGGGGEGGGRRRRRGEEVEGGVKLVRCGACNAMNLKTDSNNHRRCGACRRNYCAVCGCCTFRKASDHFGGAKPCKQHSGVG